MGNPHDTPADCEHEVTLDGVDKDLMCSKCGAALELVACRAPSPAPEAVKWPELLDTLQTVHNWLLACIMDDPSGVPKGTPAMERKMAQTLRAAQPAEDKGEATHPESDQHEWCGWPGESEPQAQAEPQEAHEEHCFIAGGGGGMCNCSYRLGPAPSAEEGTQL